jgi:hypothetical protein
VTVVVRRRCADAGEATRLAQAVAVDDPAHVRVGTEGAELVVHVDPASAASARATLDDLLACLGAAERMFDDLPSASPARAPRR